jgi:hypothetical protein
VSCPPLLGTLDPTPKLSKGPWTETLHSDDERDWAVLHQKTELSFKDAASVMTIGNRKAIELKVIIPTYKSVRSPKIRTNVNKTERVKNECDLRRSILLSSKAATWSNIDRRCILQNLQTILS